MKCKLCGYSLHTFSLLSPVCGGRIPGRWSETPGTLGKLAWARCWACPGQCPCCGTRGCWASLASCPCRACAVPASAAMRTDRAGEGLRAGAGVPLLQKQGCCLPRFCSPHPGSPSWGSEHFLNHPWGAFGTISVSGSCDLFPLLVSVGMQCSGGSQVQRPYS